MKTDSINIIKYSTNHKEEWDNYCDEISYSTILHRRNFLSYHADRFKDYSLLAYYEGEIVAVMSAAVDNTNRSRIISHPGATYGGLLFKDREDANKKLVIFDAVLKFYKRLGFKSLIYKQVPNIYYPSLDESDTYILFRNNAKHFRCDISSHISPFMPTKYSKRRIRSIKKAKKLGIYLSKEQMLISNYWDILKKNLRVKHGKEPVHTLEEIKLLMNLFPSNINIITAKLNEALIAGILIFESNHVMHAQYIAADIDQPNSGALDLIIDSLVQDAHSKNKILDFGISSTNDGSFLNAGLYRFKFEFGSQDSCYNQYEIALK